MSTMYERIEQLCASKGISGYKLCKDLGIAPSTMTELRKGRHSTMKAEKAALVADYFGVSVQYLIGDDNEKKPAIDGELSNKEQEFYDKAIQLSSEKRAQLESYLDFLLSTQ